MEKQQIGPWLVEIRRNGAGQATELHITPNPQAGTITAGITHRLVRDVLAIKTQGLTPSDKKELDRAIRIIRDEYRMNPLPGRRGRSPEFWANLAYAYVLLFQSGENPIIYIAREAKASRRDMADQWMQQARKKGYLTPPNSTFPGGELTFKAMDVLGTE